MNSLCDIEQLKYELAQANGDRLYGRVEIDDVQKALPRFATVDVVVVMGQANEHSVGSDDTMTFVVLIARDGLAVGEVGTTQAWLAKSWSTPTMSIVEGIYPELIKHMDELIYRFNRE